jgi:hypothetical protein
MPISRKNLTLPDLAGCQRRAQKTRSLKKLRNPKSHNANVPTLNKEADPEALRISINVKAKVTIGNFSSEGEALH